MLSADMDVNENICIQYYYYSLSICSVGKVEKVESDMERFFLNKFVVKCFPVFAYDELIKKKMVAY